MSMTLSLSLGITNQMGGAAPFTGTPAMAALTDIPGLVIDFDAADAGTISATGALVNTWTNKGSYGGSAASTSTNRPSTGTRTMGALNTLDFNGANHMDISSECFPLTAAVYTAFRVWYNDLGATASFLDLGQNALAGSVRTGVQTNAGNVASRIYQYSGASAISDGAAPESSLTNVVSTLRGEAALAYNYVNGQTRSGANGAPTYGAMGVWRIAGDPDNTSSRWNGAISEIAAYNRTLTLDEQALVEGFLAWKWGLQANLYSGNEWSTKDPRNHAKIDNVVCWGNSFTENAFLASNLRWPAILQANTGRKVSNQGIGGQTSTQIAARANVDVKYTDRIRIIEAGTNGADATFDVQTDIAGMVAYKPVSKYIILGVVRTKNETVGTGGYNGKVATNAALLSTYGTKFIDIMELAVELQAPGGPYPDATAYANRVIQDALLLDTLHWTAPLMAYIELWVRQKMTELNY
ncbi:LamG-like jellyroll fold domain-containing protein [Rhizobium leguminosarum]